MTIDFKIDPVNFPDGGKKILQTINNAGFEALFVGGCVRDLIMGKEVKDFDIATNMPVDEVESTFNNVVNIGQSKDFGIVCVVIDGEPFEVAHFRKEEDYSDNRHPDSVELVSDFTTDTSRRDFTINAIGCTVDGHIVDPQNGLADIGKKVIRCVGDPRQRFSEDSLRIIRMSRFAARFGFSIDGNTFDAAHKLVNNIRNVSRERIGDELFKVASYGGPQLADFFEIMADLASLQHIHIHMVSLLNKDLKHTFEHHPEGNVWQHVMAALRHSRSRDPIVNLGIAFHDVGKTVTMSVESDDSFSGGLRYRYQNHAAIGADMVEEICDSLKLSSEHKKTLSYVAKNHMNIWQILKMKRSTILEMIRDPRFETLLQVSLVDDSCRGEASDPEFIQSCLERIEEVKSSVPSDYEMKVRKMINGHLIMSLLGIKGSQIGLVKKDVTDFVLNNFDEVSEDDVIRIIKERHG